MTAEPAQSPQPATLVPRDDTQTSAAPPTIPAVAVLHDVCASLRESYLIPAAMLWLVEQSGYPVSRELKNAVLNRDQDRALALLGGRVGEVVRE